MSDGSAADAAEEYERLESFLIKLTLEQEFREAYAKDPVPTMTAAGLSKATQQIILTKDEVGLRKLMGPQQFGIGWLGKFGLTTVPKKP